MTESERYSDGHGGVAAGVAGGVEQTSSLACDYGGGKVADDLYEFSGEHIGRKSYVSVQGHSKSVPKYKTYKGTDGRNHIHPDYGGTWDGISNSAPMIMADIGEYLSPLDMTTFVTSRSQHRDMMKRHGVIEVGNEVMRPRAEQPMERAGRDIARAMEQIRSR